MSKRTLKSIVLSGDIRNIESFLDKALFTIFLGNMETAVEKPNKICSSNKIIYGYKSYLQLQTSSMNIKICKPLTVCDEFIEVINNINTNIAKCYINFNQLIFENELEKSIENIENQYNLNVCMIVE